VPARAGTPDYRNAATVLFPDVGHLLGAPQRMLVIDRGMSAGVRVAVRFDSATIRIERVADAIMSGDLAALQR